LNFLAGTVRNARAAGKKKGKHNMLLDILPVVAQAAETASTHLGGGLILGGAGLGAAIGVGLVGSKAAEATGRNPGASGKILTIAIIGMALAEAIAIYALIVIFVKGY
jgi:F-type H+-transporting ATPase subunit c